LPLISKSSLLRLIHLQARYVPIVARGLAIAFFVVAVGTAALNIGNYPSASARYGVAALFVFFGLVSLGIAASVKPILRRLMRSMLGGSR
jgi:hypothetical protein